MAKKKTKEQFISEAVLIHGNKYDYSKFNYQNAHYKSIIICPEHGEFWQTPHEHVSGKQGCPICGKEKVVKLRTDTKEDFIKKHIRYMAINMIILRLNILIVIQKYV